FHPVEQILAISQDEELGKPLQPARPVALADDARLGARPRRLVVNIHKLRWALLDFGCPTHEVRPVHFDWSVTPGPALVKDVESITAGPLHVIHIPVMLVFGVD